MVEVKTKLDINTNNILFKYNLKRFWWVFLAFTILLTFTGVIAMLDNDKGSFEAGIGIIIFGVLFLPFCLLLLKIFQKSIKKSSPYYNEEIEEVYKFETNKMILEQTIGNNFHSTVETDYSYFYKVNETENYWFLFINTGQSHVVPKDKVVEGSVEELNEIFAINLGHKFKPLKKKVKDQNSM